MSTYGYGLIAKAREDRESPSADTSKYVETLAALVPAEVLAAEAIIVQLTTTTTNGQTTFTNPRLLADSFWGLIALAVFLYVAPRLKGSALKDWGWMDLGRIWIPPAAFVGWAMLQPTSPFTAAYPSVAQDTRVVVGVFVAIVLAAVAGTLSYKATSRKGAAPAA
jgi:hypothetical protein